MADTKVKLDIETTANTSGVERTEKGLQELEDELKALQAELRKLPVGSAEFTKMGNKVSDAQKQVTAAHSEIKKLGATMGRNGDAGRAILTFSQGFEDAQYGIRGVLNNIPTLIASLGGGAGLAGVISIAAVAGSLLWEKLGGDSAAAEKPVKDVTDRYKELLDIYTKFAKVRRERNDDALEKEAAAIKRTLGGIDTDLKIKTGENDLQSTIATLLETFRLTRDRVQLQALERQIASASGQTLLDLSKNRASLVDGIYQRELQIQRLADERKVKDAQDRIAAAAAKKDVLGADAATTGERAKALAQGNEELAQKLTETAKENRALAQEISGLKEIVKANAKTVSGPGGALASGVQPGSRLGDTVAIEARIKELQDKIETNDATLNRTRAKSQANAPEVEAAAKDFTDVTESYRQAVEALQEAQRNLENLSAGQDAKRTIADASNIDSRIQSAGEETAQKIEAGIAEAFKLIGSAAETPEVQSTAAKIRSLAQGGITGGEQNEVLGLFQQLLSRTQDNNNQTAGLLSKIIGTIDNSVTTQSRLEGALKEVSSRLQKLENNAKNKNP